MPRAPLTPEQEMIKAAKAGNLARVLELLAVAPELKDAREESGATALHYAAWKGRPEVAAALLEAGADVSLQWQDGHVGGTPLHAAAHGNQRAIAELLLQHGADPRAVSCNGRSVLEETGLHSAKPVANLLKRYGVEAQPG